MKRSFISSLCTLAATLAISACNSGGTSSLPATAAQSAAAAHPVPEWQAKHLARAACPPAGPGKAQCAALVMNEGVVPATAPGGWGPSDFRAVYKLPSSSKGSGEIIGIVDAYDNPNVASDLAEYRTTFGLPPANFYKYNEKGEQSNYPPGNKNWGFEIDLDVEMVSAACPNCTIYLVEATNNSLRNLGRAVERATKLGAHIVSNSWGCYSTGCTWKTSVFNRPNVTYLAAAGDLAYGSYPPAQFANVISVGGTELSKSGSQYSEVVWRDTSGACALNIPKPAWQHDPSCSTRTANDIAAVSFNIAEYDSYSYGGWVRAAGTSCATPLLASVFALAGNVTKHYSGQLFWTLPKKKLKKDIHVISSGSNGCPASLQGSYLCTAGTGQFGTYSGPTGWGTPNGIGAF
ncbi:MAG: S8 family serine peptidase [Candidatus Cybelea sp.]